MGHSLSQPDDYSYPQGDQSPVHVSIITFDVYKLFLSSEFIVGIYNCDDQII